MIILADAGVERLIVVRLREEGHIVYFMAEMQPRIPDDIVLQLSIQYGATLLTLDKDFGEMVFRKRQKNNGIILLRFPVIPIAEKIAIVLDLIDNHADALHGSFTVVTQQSVRMRPMP